MPPIDLFVSPGTWRRKVFQGVLAALYGQRGVRVTPGGSITSHSDLASAWSPECRDRAQRLLQLLVPSPKMQARHTLTRIGSAGDGGYCLLNIPTACVVSAGIGDNDSFDLQFAEQGARVLQIDRAQDSAPSRHRLLKFVKGSVGPGNGEFSPSHLKGIHEELFLSGANPGPWLLKLDIEGGEWATLAASTDLGVWDQIIVEFHDLGSISDPEVAEMRLSALEQVSRTHAPVYVHGNSCCGFVNLGGIPVPDTLEVTFARLDHVVAQPTQGFADQLAFRDDPWTASNIDGRADLWLWGISPTKP